MSVKYTKVVEEDLDLGSATVAVPMPGGGTQTGHQINRSTFFEFNVRKYGAAGDGSTDDTVAVQKAITAAIALTQASFLANAIVYFPAGVYVLSAALSALGANRVQFRGESRATAILQWTDTATTGLTIDTISNASVQSNLSVDAHIGDYTVTVQAGAGSSFTVGAWAYIEDSSALHGTLLTRVYSISGDVITLAEALPIDMLTANTATLRSYVQYPLLEGVEVRDLTFSCVKAETTANKLTLLFLSRLNMPRLVNCIFDGSVGPLVTTRALKNGIIDQCDFKNALTNNGAGVEAQTSTGLTIQNCSSYHTRFGFTLARSPRGKVTGCNATAWGDPAQIGRMMKFSGGSNFSVCSGNTSSDAPFTGIRVENSAYVSITGNTWLSNSLAQTGAGMIELSADANLTHHCSVTGNVVYGGPAPSGFLGAGGIVIAADVAGIDTYHVISGNVVQRCGSYGIYINSSHNTVVGNTVGSRLAGGAICFVTPSNGYNIIDDNVFITEDAAAGSPAIYTLGSAGHNIIGVNKYTAALSLSTLDTIVATSVWKRPGASATAVHTGANVTETTAWDYTVTGGTFSQDNDCCDLVAHFSTGATANNKIFKLKIGTTVVTFTLPGANDGNGANFTLRYNGVFLSALGGFLYGSVTLSGRSSSGSFIYDFGAGSGDDWSIAQHIKLTMTNAAAVANDCNFDQGMITFNGIQIAPTPAS